MSFYNRLRTGFNRAFSGGNLEVNRFGLYLLFPIGFMYYFGIGLEEDIERAYQAHIEHEQEMREREETRDERRAKTLQMIADMRERTRKETAQKKLMEQVKMAQEGQSE
ncbi:hypothetical protein BZA70DRAFT_300695 [Myxozyma melibiosi]|uniref:Uncharacterized protein n=1 Tax=Myxozyma melibiosi TaxID=54550 RepID=A0ABR1FBK9_9ASCO